MGIYNNYAIDETAHIFPVTKTCLNSEQNDILQYFFCYYNEKKKVIDRPWECNLVTYFLGL